MKNRVGVARWLSAGSMKQACIWVLFGLLIGSSADRALAQTTTSEQERLFQRMFRSPTDFEATAAFVRIATANRDYEAAIGALERLLFYNPHLWNIKYELGRLYYQLGAYDLARRYFREAEASPNVDEATRQNIASYQKDADQRTQQSRFSGFAQTGLRSQTNANFSPSGGVTRFGGIDIAATDRTKRASDTNWFAVLGLSHDYDLENERGDILETRFLGYKSQQFRFHDLDVGTFDLSFGPRTPLPQAWLPGASIKPYIVAGNTWVGSARYLSSAGVGLQVSLPIASNIVISPEFEWRNVNYNNSDYTTATFGTGNTFTGGISSSVIFSDQLRLDSRGYYRRGLSSFTFQQFEQWTVELALTFQFASPFRVIPGIWSVAPFGRYIQTAFNAANPYIDPLVVRTDNQWSTGLALNAPLTDRFGMSVTVQYDQIQSTLPNYRQNNFLVMAGPTARF